MAIHTRFGSELKVLKPADENGYVDCERIQDGSKRDFHVSDLLWDTQEEYDEQIMGNKHMKAEVS